MLKAITLDLEGTVLTSEARFTKVGINEGSNEPNYIKYNEFTPISTNKNIYFDEEMCNITKTNEQYLTDENGFISDGTNSIDVKFNFESISDFVSPLVDLEGLNFATIHNVIDNHTDGDDLGDIMFQRSETYPNIGTGVAKHVTKVTSLAQTATGLKILLSAHKPSEASFDVYYRTNSNKSIDNGNILSQDWILVEPEVIPPSDENPNVYREYRYLPTELDVGDENYEVGYMKDFDQYQIKIVMKSSNTSKVPMFKDLRTIALYD
jgi:hypothetical protein